MDNGNGIGRECNSQYTNLVQINCNQKHVKDMAPHCNERKVVLLNYIDEV